jgi:O-antigen/teichoic acid export membrane protein
MSRARRYLQGVGVSYLQVVLAAACGLWLTRFLLGRIGQDELGAWFVLLPLLGYLELIDLGVVAVLPREVAYATGRADGAAGGAAAVLGLAQRVVLQQLPLAVLAAAVFWGLSQLSGAASGHAAAVLALLYVVLFPTRIYPAALQGLQDLAALGWINLICWALQFTLTVSLVLAGLGLWGLVVGFAAQRVASVVLAWWRLCRRFPAARPDRGASLDRGKARTLLRQGLWVSLSRVSQVLLNGTEVIVVGMLLGPAAVVLYSCTAKLTTLFAPQVYTLATTAESALSELRGQESPKRLVVVSGTLREAILLASGLMVCVVLATNDAFVAWWVGPERYGGLALTAVLAGTMIVRHFHFTLGHLLYCLGQERAVALISLADGAVGVAATALFVGLYGPLGAALGSLAAVVLVSLPACLFLLGRVLDVSRLALLRPHLSWLGRFLAVAVAVTLVGQHWQPRTVAGLVGLGVCVCLVYLAVMCSLVRRSPLWAYLGPLLSRFQGWFLSSSGERRADCDSENGGRDIGPEHAHGERAHSRLQRGEAHRPLPGIAVATDLSGGGNPGRR